MHQPDIYLLGIRLQEPMTVFTNFLITGFCFYAFWILQKTNRSEKTILYLKLYFLFLGCSAFFGGLLGHGLQYALGLEGKLPGWIISIIAVYFMECSAVEYATIIIKTKKLQLLNWLNLGFMGLLIFLTFYYKDFKFVIFHSFYGFIGVAFILHFLIYKKSNDLASLTMMRGIGLLLVAVFIFGYGISPHIWFNQNDLSHLFMVWACFLFLKAGLNFQINSTSITTQKQKVFPKKPVT